MTDNLSYESSEFINEVQCCAEETLVASYFRELIDAAASNYVLQCITRTVETLQQSSVQSNNRLRRHGFYRLVVATNNMAKQSMHQMVLCIPIRPEVCLYRLKRLLQPRKRPIGKGDLLALSFAVDRVRLRLTGEALLKISRSGCQAKLLHENPPPTSTKPNLQLPQLELQCCRHRTKPHRFWPTIFTIDFVNCALNRAFRPRTASLNKRHQCLELPNTAEFMQELDRLEEVVEIPADDSVDDFEQPREVIVTRDMNRPQKLPARPHTPHPKHTFDKPSLSSILKQKPAIPEHRKSKISKLSCKSDRGGHQRTEKYELPLSPTSVKRIRRSYSITCEKRVRDQCATAQVKLSVTVRDAELLLLQPKKLSSFAKGHHKRTISQPTDQRKDTMAEAKRISERCPYGNRVSTIQEEAQQAGCTSEDIEAWENKLKQHFMEEVAYRFISHKLHNDSYKSIRGASKLARYMAKKLLSEARASVLAAPLCRLYIKTLTSVWSTLKDHCSSTRRLSSSNSQQLEDHINTLSRHVQLLDQLDENQRQLNSVTEKLEAVEQQNAENVAQIRQIRTSTKRVGVYLLARILGEAVRSSTRRAFNCLTS